MPNQVHYERLERMYLSAPANKLYTPQIHISEGRAEVTFPVRPDLFHAAGAVHGAVYFKALDDSAFFAANSLVENVFVLTVSFTIYLVRPISEGEMKAEGRVIHRTKRLFIAESEVVGSDGKEIARGSGMFMYSNVPLTPEIGYK